MRYALYVIDSKLVIQWQDTNYFNYGDPPPEYARLELDDPLPPEFNVYEPPSGYWVVDGALTKVAPPPSNYEIWFARSNAISAKAQAVLASRKYADGSPYLMSAEVEARLTPMAFSSADFPDVTSVGFREGSPQTWRQLTIAELKTVMVYAITVREKCAVNEQAHIEAVGALFAAGDRDGLLAYDTDTGWPPT